MGYDKFVFTKELDLRPGETVTYEKNAVSWRNTGRIDATPKKYYVVKYKNTENGTPTTIVSDYGVPVNRYWSNINGVGGRVYIDRETSTYAGNTTGQNVVAPRSYTQEEVMKVQSWREREWDTCPLVSFGDTIRIRFAPDETRGKFVEFGYYDTNENFVTVGQFADGGLYSGVDYIIPPGHQGTGTDNQYFKVDRTSMEEQSDIRNSSSLSLMRHVAVKVSRLNCDLTFEFQTGMNNFYYRVMDGQTVYQDWQSVIFQYISTIHSYKMIPTQITITVPYGSIVQIYGTANSGYSFEYEGLRSATRENPLEIDITHWDDEEYPFEYYYIEDIDGKNYTCRIDVNQ